jgi:hypothetical protein
MALSNKIKLYFPILLLITWLGFTILVFIFGPWKYNLIDPFVFYSYLFLVHLALFLGYSKGLQSTPAVLSIKIEYDRFVNMSILVSFLYLIIKTLLTRGGDLANFFNTFRNASYTYITSSYRYVNIFSYLDIIFKPISIIAITNAIFNHGKLKRSYKYMIYILILITIFSSIGSATRSSIVQIFVFCLAALMLGIYNKTVILTKVQRALILVSILSFLVGFLMYSNLLVNTREGITTVNRLTGDPPRENYYLYKITPPDLHPFIDGTSFYLSHSYYQLNRALFLPYKGLGFGLSNSYFIIRNIERISGWNGLRDISYGLRLDDEVGAGYGLYWSTFYTWIASDFTFPGTILVVFFIGLMFSLALKDALLTNNPFSVTSFCTIFYVIFHFVFNNPLQDGAGITTCFVIPLIWLITRKARSDYRFWNSIMKFLSMPIVK